MDVENKYGTLAIQMELLKLLKAFDAFCQQFGVKYTLSGGSLLGAVRHKGFIPWDDDIDCIVDRNNFNKLCDVIKDNKTLQFERWTKDTLWIGRVRLRQFDYQGSYLPTLDVFIVDNCPDNASIAKIKLLIVKMLHGMCVYSMSLKRKGSLLMKICSVGTFLLGRLFPSNLKFKWLDNVSQWGNNKPSKYVKIYNDQYFALKSSYPSAIMDIQRCIRMQFEDITVNGLAEYDSYLKLIYGDYMTPPELSKRSPQHIRQ